MTHHPPPSVTGEQPDLWGEMTSGGTASFSPDGRYRYYLTRTLVGSGAPVHFCMLNPSVGTADVNDPTLTRCEGFARRLNASSLHVWNLFALTATKPALLAPDVSAVGEHNLSTISDALLAAQASKALVIAGWGAHRHPVKARQVHFVTTRAAALGVTLHALHETQGGDPGHPLFLKGDRRPRPWSPPTPANTLQAGDPTPAALIDQVVEALAGINRSVNSEAELQRAAEDHLQAKFPGRVRTQVNLGADGRVDLMVDALALELKTQGSHVAVLRQCARYARSDAVEAVLLVATTRSLVARMPQQLSGKALATTVIGGGGRR